MEDDIQINHLESNLIFGKLTDTPHVQFVPIIGINNQPVNVPCTSLEITIAQLIQSYLKNTNHSKLFKEKPLLIVDQGSKKQSFAEDSQIVAGFGFDLKKNCFRVIDEGNMDPRRRDMMMIEREQELRRGGRSSSQIQRNEAGNQIEINIIVINFPEKLKLKIALNKKVLDLKKKAIAQIAPLKKYTPDLLNIRLRDTVISNDNELLSKYQIIEGSTLIFKIKQSNGCFSSSALVSLADHRTVKISQIKVGDQVLSYNVKQNVFERDIVTFVKICRVQECLNIVFEDESQLKTTPNHLFLCEDGQFRCYTTDILKPQSQNSLKVGMRLKTTLNSSTKIKQMYCNRVQFTQSEFFHLSISKNHTFIVNNLITHNMFIKIKLAKGEQKIDVSPATQIAEIKEKLEEVYFIQIHNQILLYNGKELQNDSTIAQNNIPKEATLQLICKKTLQFNLIKEEVPIRMANGSHKLAGELRIGDSLATFDTVSGKLSKKGDLIQFIEQIDIGDYFYVGLGQYQNTIGLSTDSYVELENGEAINIRDICYGKYETANLKTIDGGAVEVKGMAHLNEPLRKKKFFKISMVSNKNLIGKSIIIHEKVINLLLIKGEKRVKKVSFGVNSGDKVELIKAKLSKLINLPEKDIVLLHNENQLSPQRTIQSYDIQTQHLVLAIIQATMSKISKSSIWAEAQAQEELVQTKIVNLQLSQTQKQPLNYYQNKDKTVEEVLKTILPNYNNAYFFTFDNLLLFPNDKLQKLQTSPNFKYAENTIVLVKNQKLSFINAMNISKEEVGNYSSINKKKPNKKSMIMVSEIVSKLQQFEHKSDVVQAVTRIMNDSKISSNDFKQKEFFLPFLYLTSRRYTEKIKKHIMNLETYRLEYGKDDEMFSLIKGIYVNMQLLPNYYKKCYMGLKNFRFSNFFKKEQTFYLHNFTIAYKREDLLKAEFQKQVGTLFHITSLNGKEIMRYSMYPHEEEILFAPFTPFLVEQIISGDNYEEVYLVELSAPITFQKDIILWVDDQPSKNQNDMKIILSKLDIEILQATSTLQAEKWIKQFGWLLNWKGLQFKIVSDMVRFEGIKREGYDKKANYTAGIDLLKILYNKHGFNVKTLIYCGKEKEAKEAAMNAGLKHQKYYQITASQPKMLEFFNINKK